MNKKYRLIISLLVIILVVGLIWKNTASKPAINEQAEPIKIGAVMSLTGFAAPWGEYGKNGIELAVKTINDAGGIDGRKVEVVIEDDHTDPKDGVSAFNKLLSVDKVQGVIGGVFDFTAQPLMPIASSSHIAFISPSNFRIAGGFDLNDQSFVMLTDFNKTIRVLQPYIASTPIKKLAVVHFKSTFGGEIAKTLDGVMKDLGRDGIVDKTYTEIGNNDFKTTIADLKSRGVDAVFLDMLGNDPVTFLRQSKQLGFNPTVMTYNGALDAFVNEVDKSPLNGAVILNWEVSSSKFNQLYKNAYTADASKSADKYFDATYVLANAIAKAASMDQVAPYISRTTFKTPNSNSLVFTQEHAIKNVTAEVQVFKEGMLVPWFK